MPWAGNPVSILITGASASDTGIGAPTPTSRTSLIRSMDRDIKDRKNKEKQKLKELEEETQTIQNLRFKMIKIGKDIKQSEHSLNQFTNVLDELEKKRAELLIEITDKQKALARIIMASQRLKRMPPITVLLTPGKPLTTAQTSMIMQSHIQTVQTETAQLQNLIASYQNTENEMSRKKESAENLRVALQKQFDELSLLLDQRQKQFTRQKIVLAEHTRSLNNMATKAKNLKDLVASIQSSTAHDSNLNQKINHLILTPDELPLHGEYQLPLSGVIKTNYGETDRFESESEGYMIESYKGALVVAPFSGQIKYAGPFKNFKNIIIIEHRDGYHSLIGGLEKIHVNVGQVIVSGEAIGILGELHSTQKSDEMRGSLYYELRHHGAPIDPAIKFSDLG